MPGTPIGTGFFIFFQYEDETPSLGPPGSGFYSPCRYDRKHKLNPKSDMCKKNWDRRK